MVGYLSSCSQLSKSDPVLEIGCGNGMLLVELALKGFTNLTGIDFVPEAIELARSIVSQEDVHVSYKVGDILDPNCLDQTYSAILDKVTLTGKKAERDLNKTLLHLEKFANKHKLEFNPQKSETCLQNLIFNVTLNEPTNKQYQNPEYLKQLSLEIINNIPKNAITIYTDGSRDELGHTGSGCLIKTTNCIEKMNRRNPDFCSVFRSELIAIYEALKSIRNTNYQDIWILTDSTYDAITPGSPQNQTTYVKNLMALLEPGGIFLLASCNWTKSELCSHFAALREFR
ncbi:METTL10 [Cordylochernes scorpioides]|uniref:METTL10 n=1 Tax=Cordylochernes scorpioides TaxID=51811 RepID=A0ABY6K7B0_9ARAC|nr:METTL10 [Cordylochernes scorpioides]